LEKRGRKEPPVFLLHLIQSTGKNTGGGRRKVEDIHSLLQRGGGRKALLFYLWMKMTLSLKIKKKGRRKDTSQALLRARMREGEG